MDPRTGPEPQQDGPAPSAEAPGAPPRRLSSSARSLRAELRADPRLPVWIRRTIIALAVGIAIAIWLNWRWGLTAAVAVSIVDTIYQSKAMAHIPADALATGAQRRTRRRLATLRTAGYQSLHGRSIPDSDQVIDHLLVGPAGVFAIDSERWDRRLPVRITGKTGNGALYHGPYSQTSRLAHARWEAAQAAALIGAEMDRPVSVTPAMVIYGPLIPWGVATLRGVEVFSGKRIRKFFKTQNKATRGHHLDAHDIGLIFQAADRTLPPAR